VVPQKDVLSGPVWIDIWVIVRRVSWIMDSGESVLTPQSGGG
jgi:hypothetical protein